VRRVVAFPRLRRFVMCGKRNGFLFVIFVGCLSVVASFPENILAQGSFPSKPISIVISASAGGQNDVMTRALAKAAEKELRQPIICENRPGGSLTVGKNYVLKSKPDGYTVGAVTTATNIYQPHMQDLPFNVLTDQRDISVYFKYTHALCVKVDAPWKTFEDIIAYARQYPGKFTYGTAGVGTTQHIVMEQIALKEKIKWSMVPFKGGSDATLAALGGHTNGVAQGPADLVPQIQAGKLRIILALNDDRWPIAPNIPTVKEKYGFYGINYQSIYGPKGIPDQAAEKLENAFKKAVDDPSYIELAKTLQVEIYYMSAKDYTKLWKSQYDEMGKIIKSLGLAK
jgi:tripartite-type tricarboxylate transporter receptor subunit TctC